MAGNKHDNGVHEQGTDETRMAYQEDTPGQSVEKYIEDRNKAYHEEAIEKKKKHFSQVFQNPLKGFPYNEEIEVKKIEEKYKPYIMKGFERVTDLYVQFRGNGEEKDFAKAKKMVMDYSKKHKLDIKDNPRNKVFGTPQEGSSAYKISLFAKFTKDKDHDFAPLYKQLSTLKTAEDHGGGYAEPIKK